MQTVVHTPAHGDKGMGWKPDTPDHRDLIFNLERKVETPESLPLVFSLRDTFQPVDNQEELGSCVPHGTGSIFEQRQKVQEGKTVTPSFLFVYYNGRVIEHTVGEDSGLQVRDGIKTIVAKGAPPQTDWAYDISKFTEKPPSKAYTDAIKDEAVEYLRIEPGGAGSPLRTAILKGNPVAFGFTVPSIFELPSWNPAKQFLPLPKKGEGVLGGHCTVAVGWDFSLERFSVPVFEIRNSWGPLWADEGYFWMDARWLNEPSRNLSSDFWIIEKVK